MTIWAVVEETAAGYIETEDNLFVLATENGELIRLDDASGIDADDWQDVSPPATTTWTIQQMATKKISELTTTTTPSSSALFPIVQDGTTLAVTLANVAANMPTISVANLTADTLTVTNNATIGGDLTITGDDLTMGTNTSGAALIADGTNFNPVVISGDISIGTTGTAAIGSGVIVNADVNSSAAIAFSKMADLTASRALVSDGSGDVSVSAVTSTEIGYLDGVSSAIQTQLDGKASSTYVPTTITVADESTDTTCFPLFVTAATGDLPPKSGSNLAFNSGTGALTATSFVGNLTGNVTGNTSGSSGSTTGNAATATALATGREISLAGDVTASGVSFDGTGNISLSTTIAANSVALSTDTTGNYIAAVSGTTNEISVSGSGSEGATATIGLPDDVTIAGNLTVNGTTTSVDTTNLEVEDPLIKLAKNNSAADSLDIGFYGLYDTSGSQDLYSGLFRDANDSGKYKLFKDLQVEPTTTVNTSGTGYATGTLVATFEGNLTGNVTGNTSGTSGSTTGNAATATALQTARNIGGVSFDGTGNIDLPGVNSAGNQNTSGTAAIATAVTVADESSDTTCFPLFSTAATGDLGPKSGSNLTFNSSSGTLGATIFSGSGSSLTGVVIETASTGSAEIPVGTTAQRDGSPATGMFRFNSTTTGFEGYDGSAWGAIGGGGGATGAGGDEVFQENERVVTTNYTLSTNKSAMCVGPLTINTGVTVTIPSGERLVIL